MNQSQNIIYIMLRIKKKRQQNIYLKTDQNQNQKSLSKTCASFNSVSTNIIYGIKNGGNHNIELVQRSQQKRSKVQHQKIGQKIHKNIKKIRQLTSMYKMRSTDRIQKQENDAYKQNCLVNKIKIVQLFRSGTFGNIYRAVLSYDTNYVEVAVKKVCKDSNYISRQQQFANILKNPYVVEFIGTYTSIERTNKDLLHKENTNILQQDNLDGKKSQIKCENQRKILNIVMKKYGNNLYQIIKLQNMQPLRIKIFLYQMVRSIIYLHSMNICHRDIKPHNFVIKGYRIYLCDFGAAKYIKQNEKSVSYVFSREYRSPQLLFDYQNYDKSVDIWALGCIAAQMVLKKPIFNGTNNLDQLIRILKVLGSPRWEIVSFCKNRIPKIPEIKGNGIKSLLETKCDQLLINLIERMLKIEPKDRVSAIQALCDPYFDDIRDQAFFRNYLRNKNLPNFFYFTKKQLFGKQQYLNKLVPFWIRQHCKRFDIKLKDYNF